MAASKKDNVNAGRVEYLGDDREGKLAALNMRLQRLRRIMVRLYHEAWRFWCQYRY